MADSTWTVKAKDVREGNTYCFEDWVPFVALDDAAPSGRKGPSHVTIPLRYEPSTADEAEQIDDVHDVAWLRVDQRLRRL